MRIYILLVLFCFSISCQIDKNKVSTQNLIYYASNYVTEWDVEYGSEDRQKMDVYLRGQKYVDNQAPFSYFVSIPKQKSVLLSGNILQCVPL